MTAMEMSEDGRVVITGASGFVGGAVVARLRAEQVPVGAIVRGVVAPGQVCGPDLEAGGDWFRLLEGCRAVVHAAARVHVMRDSASDPLRAYRDVNVDGTLKLAEQAAAAGVRRFVFLSSVKVNGEQTIPGRPFLATDPPAPSDAYAISKAEAEAGLAAIARATGMEVVVIRSPLVYGPGVKANFRTMMEWLQRGLPLPLGAVEHNRRSLVALDNLVDLIITCLDHPAAANQVFLVGDDEDLSTAELLRRLGAAMGVPVRLFPVPIWALRAGAKLMGRDAMFQRVAGDLQVDVTLTRERLGWRPPIPVDEGLRRLAAVLRP